MTLEELPGEHRAAGRMEQAGDALEEVLSKALSQRSLTLGVYEAAKLLNVGFVPRVDPSLFFQNPHASQWKDPALSQLMCFCRERRYADQWVPVINLPER
ncbi:growth arrest and DNA damage-inducible protein GADD45 alpha [Oxyura jamaicensis]|uniref:growth arrest and DNA damage-inducible protein GADD45 alpha n=1 Tax=Oxyura jamaicensis TaxID=8884 RepID=UPI0015A516A6|nr:growth arrest and DNA damage-inducible protein GADD45 alpha [Oxyura jamaicensis]